jgi:hypothetical protein
MISNHDQDGEESHPTLFGFKTNNKFAANMLNTVYGIVMVVSMAFAYYALSLILVGWPIIITFLAAIAVVGLPYCIKIILYGRKEFTLKMAYLCIAISILPTIFDFIGFYAKTSVRQSLIETKFEVLEKINYFDKEAREKINQNIIKIEQDLNLKLAEIETTFNARNSELAKEVIDAEQTYLDETEGVGGKITSGKIGIGPKAKELEADIRKAQASTELKSKNLESNKSRETERVTKDFNTEKESLEQGLATIDGLVSVEDNKGLVFEVSKANSFDDLAETLIKLNTSINIISSKLKLNPEYVKFSTENIIQLSFGSLLRGDITAIICLALAVLLEIVDTVIVYMIRGIKRKPEEKQEEEKSSSVRETTHYKWEDNKEGKIITDLKEEKIDPEYIHLYHK